MKSYPTLVKVKESIAPDFKFNGFDENTIIVRITANSLAEAENKVLDTCLYAVSATAFESLSDNYLSQWLDDTDIIMYSDFLGMNKAVEKKHENALELYQNEITHYERQIADYEKEIEYFKELIEERKIDILTYKKEFLNK